MCIEPVCSTTSINRDSNIQKINNLLFNWLSPNFRWVQKKLVQATYWHDPLNEEMYKKYSSFLSDINNELNVNQTYKDRLLTLENFVMVKFLNDSVVQPVESEWFGFYKPGQAEEIVDLRSSDIYKEVSDPLFPHNCKDTTSIS